jgi:hypothetical protein
MEKKVILLQNNFFIWEDKGIMEVKNIKNDHHEFRDFL